MYCRYRKNSILIDFPRYCKYADRIFISKTLLRVIIKRSIYLQNHTFIVNTPKHCAICDKISILLTAVMYSSVIRRLSTFVIRAKWSSAFDTSDPPPPLPLIPSRINRLSTHIVRTSTSMMYVALDVYASDSCRLLHSQKCLFELWHTILRDNSCREEFIVYAWWANRSRKLMLRSAVIKQPICKNTVYICKHKNPRRLIDIEFRRPFAHLLRFTTKKKRPSYIRYVNTREKKTGTIRREEYLASIERFICAYEDWVR